MIAYGYKTNEDDDPLIKLVDVATDQFSKLTEAGGHIIDVFPLRKWKRYRLMSPDTHLRAVRYIPSWVPGINFHKTISKCKATLEEMANVPHNFVKRQMVSLALFDL